MTRWLYMRLVVPLLLAGCAITPAPVPPGDEVFRDDLFAPALPPPDPEALFALSPAMRSHLHEKVVPQVRRKGAQMALIDALYTQGDLRLEYDARITRTAAEAFEARMGNCLSLVIMTTAFARELGLDVRFQEVAGAPAVEHSGDLTFLVGHVNLVLGSGLAPARSAYADPSWTIVDFLPGQDLQRQRTSPLDEKRLRAMFMNNRAAEELAAGRVREAYWWARAAHAQDRGFANLYNTLGVIYRRAGALADAERTLRIAQTLDPGSEPVSTNLAGVLQAQGREADAARLALARPSSGASRYERAREALAEGRVKQALAMLQGELGLTPRNAELHYWLAMAHALMGDAARARLHLEQAASYSATDEQRVRYSGKLERLKAQLAPPLAVTPR